MIRYHRFVPSLALSVPSPLAGEGQGGGYPTACSMLSGEESSLKEPDFHPRLPMPPPPTPTLPRKGGGSGPVAWLAIQDQLTREWPERAQRDQGGAL
jgi:hypothetical protein